LLVELDRLTKTFGPVTVVDDVSFAIGQGEVLGLLGPNGAGKSTIIQMAMGLLRPTRGEVRIFGLPLARHRGVIAGRMNVMSPYLALPARLTVAENLEVYARLYGVEDRAAKVSELLETFAIGHLRDQLVSRLSSGEATRAALAKALVNDPELLLLDEPTAFLDPQAAGQIRETILRVQRLCGTSVLYTSHNMQEVEQICSRIVFLHRGRILAAGSPLEVSRAVLRTELNEPALEEVYRLVAAGGQR
jgi:ABC-2 type transport system ATP-binding protein